MSYSVRSCWISSPWQCGGSSPPSLPVVTPSVSQWPGCWGVVGEPSASALSPSSSTSSSSWCSTLTSGQPSSSPGVVPASPPVSSSTASTGLVSGEGVRLSLSTPAVRSESVVMMTSWVGPGLVVAMDTLGLSAVGGLAMAGRGGRGDGGRTWLSGTGCSTSVRVVGLTARAGQPLPVVLASSLSSTGVLHSPGEATALRSLPSTLTSPLLLLKPVSWGGELFLAGEGGSGVTCSSVFSWLVGLLTCVATEHVATGLT